MQTQAVERGTGRESPPTPAAPAWGARARVGAVLTAWKAVGVGAVFAVQAGRAGDWAAVGFAAALVAVFLTGGAAGGLAYAAVEARGWNYYGRWLVGAYAAVGAVMLLGLAGAAAAGARVAPSAAWGALAGVALAPIAGLVYARMFRRWVASPAA